MLSCGIVGLPNVGKSTLFNALLKKQAALAANYPFATIEPNVGVVPVPDERLEKLADLVVGESQPDGFAAAELTRRVGRPPLVPTMIKFVDIAGLVKGASQGEGLGNQFLSHIREVDAIVQVVRNFSDENIIRSGSVNPKSDIEVVNTELILVDLQTVEKRSQVIGNRKQATSDGSLNKVRDGLNQGILVSQMNLSNEERMAIRDLQLLTAKPTIYVYNSDEAKVAELSSQTLPSSSWASPGSDSGQARMTSIGNSDAIFVSAKMESELSALSDDEQKAYLSELNIKESGLDKVIKKAYEILGLITFLTAGPKEVRAWTTKKGSKAPQAAGVIHTDFERGFIAAEVIVCDQLLSSGSHQKAKDLGQIRLEGKEYEMKDGDVVEFRFSV